MKPRKPSKYTTLFVIQSHWPWQKGWEDVTAEEKFKEAQARLREYRENEPMYSHRLIRRRALRESAPA